MISGAKKRIPKRRFKEFLNAGAWEQRKLGDITKANPFKSYISNTLEIGEYEVIQQGEVPIAGYADGSPCYNYENITIFGDHTLSLFKPNKPFFIASDGVKLLSPLVKIDGQFFYYLLEKYKPKSEGYKRHFTILKNCEAYFPNNIEEQTKISTLLNRMNSIITLHQRKLDKLQATKKALLQEMFPEEGQDKPKRRFKGFTDAWEQCKLGDLLILLKDGSHGTHKNTSEGVYLLSAKNIKNGRINIMPDDRIISWDDYNVIHKNYELQIGDILLTIVGSIGETAIYNLKMKITFQRSVAFLRPNSKLKNGFLYTLINTDRFQNQLQTKQVVSAQPGIYLGDLASINITYPKNVSEQEKIYNIFKGIEDSITLHQRKLDKLKNLKQAYLNEMFV